MIVLGEAHLRRILKSYARYYNGVRTHRSLNKDAPVSRSVQRTGVIRSRAILGGRLHIIVGFTFSVHTTVGWHEFPLDFQIMGRRRRGTGGLERASLLS